MLKQTIAKRPRGMAAVILNQMPILMPAPKVAPILNPMADKRIRIITLPLKVIPKLHRNQHKVAAIAIINPEIPVRSPIKGQALQTQLPAAANRQMQIKMVNDRAMEIY